MNTVQTKRQWRQNRVRAKIVHTDRNLRLSVFRSNTAIYAQLIESDTGKIKAAASSLKGKKTGMAAAQEVGEIIAKEAKGEKVFFDRGSYKYTGRVKALAESARKAGLIF